MVEHVPSIAEHSPPPHSQGMHSVRPVVSAYVPAEHAWQDICPDSAVAVPTGHSEQKTDPVVSANVPSGQGAHAALWD